MEQQQFAFDANARERRATLMSAIHRLQVGTAGEIWLLFVNDVGRGNPVRRSYPQIADRLGVSRSTAVRTVQRLIDFGLLTCKPDEYCTGGTGPNSYSINWPGVAAAVTPPRVNLERGSVKMERGGVKMERPNRNKNHHGSIRVPPPPMEEEDLRALLIQVGMQDIDGTLAESTPNAPAGELVAIVRHWQSRPGAWGLPGLRWRLRNARAGQDPAEGWPTPNEAATVVATAETRKEARRLQRAENARVRAQVESDQRVAAELERKFGATLDAMTGEERETLAEQVCGGRDNFAFEHYLKTPRFLRREMLEILAK